MNLFDIVAPLTIEEAKTDYQKRRQRERDVDAGKPVARQPKNPQTDYAKKRAEQKRQEALGEDSWHGEGDAWHGTGDAWHGEEGGGVAGMPGLDEAKLNVGDPIIVTAPNEFEGKTGEISEFSPSGKFVIVNLYNYGEHSMHLSDVEYNQYADEVDEDTSTSPVTSAITRRILQQRLDLLKQYGPELVGAAVDNVADYVGDVEEIGSSDVSAWVAQVERMLKENPPDAFAEEAHMYRGPHGNADVDRKGGVTRVTRRDWVDPSNDADSTAKGSKHFSNRKLGPAGSVQGSKGHSSLNFIPAGGSRKYAKLDHDANDAPNYDVDEGWSHAIVSQRTGQPRTPYSVYIKGQKWKDFENDDHAEAVANKLRAKFKADGRDPGVITIAATDYDKGVAETTGDEKFDKMLKGITGKKAVAKQQKTDTKQQASNAFGSMFGGGNPADKLSIKKKGVAEGKGLAKKVKIVKGPDAGKTGWIREVKHGAFKGAPKTYYIDLDDGGQANNLPATALRLVKEQGMAEGSEQQLSVQQLATVSDAALDSAYHYGRSQPGNTFGWQANLKSAAFAKQMIDRGVTDIEQISDAIHKGWNVTAQAFVKNPMMFDDSKTMAPEKLQAKIAQRQKLMTQQYAQLPEDEKEKDRVVARAMLQAITGGQQSVAEDTGSWIVYDPKTKQIKKRFKTHTAGKSYAQTHGLGFASSEYYFDRVKGQEAVAETSLEKLARYKKVAGADATAADKRGDFERGNKRFKGIVRATNKEFDKSRAQGVAEDADHPHDRGMEDAKAGKEYDDSMYSNHQDKESYRRGRIVAKQQAKKGVAEVYTPAPAKPFRNPRGFNKQGTGVGNRLAQQNRYELERNTPVKTSAEYINRQANTKPGDPIPPPFGTKSKIQVKKNKGVAEAETDYSKRRQRERNMELGEDDVDDFVKGGGKITYGKPQKGPRRPGLTFGSKHIGVAGGAGKPGQISGRGANTGKNAKPVVAVESYWTKLQDERNTKIASLVDELKESIK